MTHMSPRSLVLTAHGSADPRAAVNTHAVADEIRRQRPSLDVRVAFCEQSTPNLRDVVADAGDDAVVTPFLLADAYHARVDIPAMIAGSGAAQADVLGEDERLVDGAAPPGALAVDFPVRSRRRRDRRRGRVVTGAGQRPYGSRRARRRRGHQLGRRRHRLRHRPVRHTRRGDANGCGRRALADWSSRRGSWRMDGSPIGSPNMLPHTVFRSPSRSVRIRWWPPRCSTGSIRRSLKRTGWRPRNWGPAPTPRGRPTVGCPRSAALASRARRRCRRSSTPALPRRRG